MNDFFKYYAYYGCLVTIGLMVIGFAMPNNIKLWMIALQFTSVAAQFFSLYRIWRKEARSPT